MITSTEFAARGASAADRSNDLDRASALLPLVFTCSPALALVLVRQPVRRPAVAVIALAVLASLSALGMWDHLAYNHALCWSQSWSQTHFRENIVMGNGVKEMVGWDGSEPPTPGFSDLGHHSRKCA